MNTDDVHEALYRIVKHGPLIKDLVFEMGLYVFNLRKSPVLLYNFEKNLMFCDEVY